MKMKFHLLSEITLVRTSRQSLPLQPDELKDKMIMKYAPKYSRSLLLKPSKNNKFVNALKKIKKVDCVEEDLKRSQKNKWRLIMQNKFKSVQIYNQPYDYEKSIQKYKAFLNVKKILLKLDNKSMLNRREWIYKHFPHMDEEEEEEEIEKFTKKQLHCFRFLSGMTNIKHVDLKVTERTDPAVLEMLNSMLRFFSSLKTLRVSCTTGKIVSVIMKCQNILKQITHLSLGKIAESRAGEYFESLLQQCKKLIYLNTDFSYQSLSEPQTHPGNCLKMFENFEKLEIIHITLEDIFYFLENFTPPPFLKHLEIKAMKGYWKDAYSQFFSIEKNKLSSSKVKDLFENNKKLTSFLEKWSSLKSLVSLGIIAQQEEIETSYILIFIRFLLKHLPLLESFQLHFECYFGKHGLPFEEYYDVVPTVGVNVGDVLNSLQDACLKLVSLQLSFSYSHTVYAHPIPEGFIFPFLTEISFPEDSIWKLDSIENLLNAVDKSARQKDIVKHIKLKMFYNIDNHDSLLHLLQILYKPLRNCEVDMKIMINDLNLNGFRDTFNPFIEKARKIPLVENVSLTVESRDQGHLEALGFLHDIFQTVRTLYSPKKKKSTLVMAEEMLNSMRNGRE